MKLNLVFPKGIVGLALSLSLASTGAFGQSHPKTGNSKAAQSRGDASGPDENVKHGPGPNDPNAKAEAPPEKGGPKTRDSSCFVHIDNRTPFHAEIYTDGNYRGDIPKYGDLTGYVGCGNTNFYARAFFTDGSTKVWGPSLYYVDGSFTWTLTY